MNVKDINSLYRNGFYEKAYKAASDEIYKKKLIRYSEYKILSLIKQNAAVKIDINETSQDKKFVSVITVNFNNLEGIKRTFESVVSQTSRDLIQFIIVDGFSNDGTLEFLNKNATGADVCVYGKDKGIYDAMNRGIELANSEYCIFMNSGDCFDQADVVEKIHKKYKSLGERPNAIYGHTRRETGEIWVAHELDNFWKGMKFSHQSVFIDTVSLKEEPYDATKSVVADYLQLYKLFINKGSFHCADMTIGHVEEVGVSGDFYSRTTERWMAVRSIKNLNVTLKEIDDFYRSLLSTKDNKFTPSFKFEANQAQLKLTANVQERVVFLISMPRSGSTLLQKILEQSDQINTLGEPWLMLPLLAGYDEDLIDAKYGQHLNVKAKEEFLRHTNNSEIINQAQQVYADSIYSSIIRESDKRYFLDKTPRYIYIVNRLKEIYPKAKFIVLLRNPAAVISSYAHTWYKDSFIKLSEDRFCRYDFEKGFEQLANFANSEFKNKHVIHYEDLVSKPDEAVSKLFGYLNLKYNEKYINYNNEKSSSKKFMFGDPKTVYSKTRPDQLHAEKWLRDVEKNNTQYDLLKLLNILPKGVIGALGYQETAIKHKLDANALDDKFKIIAQEFGTNTNKLNEIRQEYNAPLKKTIGVLITSFNNEDTIILALKSVITQSKKPDLIVVADDCSTDDSINAIQSFINIHGETNIRLESRDFNVGVSKNRDLAIRGMETDYICTLDGDDLFYPGKLEAEYLLMQDSENRVAFSNILVETKDKLILQDTSAYSEKSKDEMISMLITRSSPVPRDMMFPKSLFLKAEGFDHGMTAYEDWALKCRLMVCSLDKSWKATGLIGTVYDRKNPGLSNLEPIGHVSNQLTALARNISFLKEYPLALSQAIEMNANLLNGKISERLKIIPNYIRYNGADKRVEDKFNSYYQFMISNKTTNKELFEKIWKLADLNL